MGEVFADQSIVGVSAVGVIPGEAGFVAEILEAAATVLTSAVRLMKPGNADSITFFQYVDVFSDRINVADDLMAGNNRRFGERQIAFNSVQVGMAETATADFDSNLVGAGGWRRELAQVQRGLLCGQRLVELHGAHGIILGSGAGCRV